MTTAGSNEAAVALVSWHERHLRGLDNRVWLSEQHAALVDRAALAKHAKVTPVGSGLRLEVDDDRPRHDLAPLEDVLAPLLSSEATVAAWRTTRAQELATQSAADQRR